MAAPLIFAVIIIGILVLGIVYSFVMDTVGFFIPYWGSHPLAGYVSTETAWGYDVVLFMLKYILLPALLGLIYYSYQKGQNNNEPRW